MAPVIIPGAEYNPWMISGHVQLAGCTPQPEARWMQQQAWNISLVIAANTGPSSYLIHDRHGSFFPLDTALRPTGIKVIKSHRNHRCATLARSSS
jgi:hypothetical protein